MAQPVTLEFRGMGGSIEFRREIDIAAVRGASASRRADQQQMADALKSG